MELGLRVRVFTVCMGSKLMLKLRLWPRFSIPCEHAHILQYSPGANISLQYLEGECTHLLTSCNLLGEEFPVPPSPGMQACEICICGCCTQAQLSRKGVFSSSFLCQYCRHLEMRGMKGSQPFPYLHPSAFSQPQSILLYFNRRESWQPPSFCGYDVPWVQAVVSLALRRTGPLRSW